jgi:hypothetical protein
VYTIVQKKARSRKKEDLLIGKKFDERRMGKGGSNLPPLYETTYESETHKSDA